MSWFSNKSFIDYDTYKLDFSSIWLKDKTNLEKMDLNLDTNIDASDTDIDLDTDYTDDAMINQNEYDTDVEIIDGKESLDVSTKSSNQKNVAKSLWNISPLKFVNMKEKLWNESEINQEVSWYSKSDLLWIISNYIQENLKDNTEILVTIEYNEEWEADKIILKTQPKYKGTDNVLFIPRLSLEKMIDWIYKSKYETVVIDDADESIDWSYIENDTDSSKKENKSDSNLKKDSSSDNDLVVEVEWKKEEKKENTTTTTTQTTTQKTTQTQTKRKTSNWLSQKDMRDAEEVFWALF